MPTSGETLIDEVLRAHSMGTTGISVTQARVVLEELKNVLDTGIAGDIVEINNNTSMTPLFQSMLSAYGSTKKLCTHSPYPVPIAFVFFSDTAHESFAESLTNIYPRLSSNARICIHNYEKKAYKEFFHNIVENGMIITRCCVGMMIKA